MKYLFRIAALFFVLGIAALSFAGSQYVTNTKHNLSKSGGFAIKSSSETEVCVFCHIPHSARPSVPLWNHELTTASYTGQLYDSDYLYRFGYAVPTSLGSLPSQAGYISRLCLSCHDGTVAIGSLTMLRGISATAGTPLVGDVSGTGVDGTGKLVSGADLLGTNLKDDHPIAIEYDATKTISFGSGTRTIELNSTTPPPVNPSPYTGVKLFKVSGSAKGYVECTSCHDPHNDTNGQFLTADKLNGTLCTACHQKTGWDASIHKTSTVSVDNTGETLLIPGTTIANASCLACHKSHSGLGMPYLLRKAEESTCFNGTTTSCHGSSATSGKKIEQMFLKTYAHPVTAPATAGRHTNLDTLYPSGGTPAGSKGLQWSDSKHSECVDCHNPHQAKSLPARVAAASWYPATVDSTSNQTNKSGPMTGVSGVEPVWPSIWSLTASYTTQDSSTKQYQICLKCHSSYALGNISTTPVSGYQTLSDPVNTYFTDQAWEFNPNNYSIHPAASTLGSGRGGGTPTPLALTAAQMVAPWNGNVGNQTMYCTDCHGADLEASTDPKGPHGSNSKFMLKGAGQYWPKNAGGNLYTLSNTDANLFCMNCHVVTNTNLAHQGSHVGATCVNCHVVVPHGTKRSRLIGYINNAADSATLAPYNDNGTSLKITGFRKANGAGSVAKSDCNTTCHVAAPFAYPNNNCGGAGCEP